MEAENFEGSSFFKYRGIFLFWSLFLGRLTLRSIVSLMSNPFCLIWMALITFEILTIPFPLLSIIFIERSPILIWGSVKSGILVLSMTIGISTMSKSLIFVGLGWEKKVQMACFVFEVYGFSCLLQSNHQGWRLSFFNNLNLDIKLFE